MEAAPNSDGKPQGSRLGLAVPLGLLATGWVGFFLTQGYVSRLAEHWGPAPDVVDALGRDAYIGRSALPYYSAVLLLDVLAVVSLAAQSVPGWVRFLKVLVGISVVPTIMLHGLVWLVAAFFAG